MRQLTGKSLSRLLKKKKEYKLEELLSRCDPESMELTKEDKEWLNAEPLGREVC